MELKLQIRRRGLYCAMKYCIFIHSKIVIIIIIIIVTDFINVLQGNGSLNTRNNGNCVSSVDECINSLLGSSQRANDLAR
jgi:hypothetical protein